VYASGFGAAELPAQAHDNALVTVEFDNHSVGTLAYVSSGARGVPKERIEVFAGDRTAILDDYTALELHERSEVTSHRLKTQDKGHDEEIRQFLASIRDGRQPIPLDAVANVHRACFAAVDSLRTGAALSIHGERARKDAGA
jgi:predicted dehydrogenase